MGRFLEMRKRIMDENITVQSSMISDSSDSTPIKPYSIKYADKDNRIPVVLGKKPTRRNMKKRCKKKKVCERRLDTQPIKTSLVINNKDIHFERVFTFENVDPKKTFNMIIQDIYYPTTKMGDMDVNLRSGKYSLLSFLKNNVGKKIDVGSYKSGKSYEIMISEENGRITKFGKKKKGLFSR